MSRRRLPDPIGFAALALILAYLTALAALFAR